MLPPPSRAARDAVLAGYRPDEGVRKRIAAYEAAAFLRLSRVDVFRPVRPGLREALLERVPPDRG